MPKKKSFLLQFHINLESYIIGSEVCINFIDFNCKCHWFVLPLLVNLRFYPPPSITSGLGTSLLIQLFKNNCTIFTTISDKRICDFWYLSFPDIFREKSLDSNEEYVFRRVARNFWGQERFLQTRAQIFGSC